jgi:predicted dehydrogenase
VNRVRISVVGAGVMGRRHATEIHASPSATLASIVDPGRSGPELAATFDVPLYRTLTDLFDRDKPDGVILATPNGAHVHGGLECVAAGVPVLVEKPIGDTVEAATRLVEAGERATSRCSPATTATTARS